MHVQQAHHACQGGRRMLITVLMLGLALSVSPLPAAHAATTITVTTTADELNSDGDCALREAIHAANRDAAQDRCPAGNGADTITLPAGSYPLSLAGTLEDAARTGDLDIASDLTITGALSTTTIIDGNRLDRVLDVLAGTTVHIANLTIRNGYAFNEPQGNPDWPYQPSALGGGLKNQGTLTLRDSIVSNNTAAPQGGGIENLGVMTLSRSVVRENQVISTVSTGPEGGGIENQGTLTIANTTITANTHNGLMNLSGTVEIRDSMISNNTAQNGAGIYNSDTMTIIGTQIRDNTADDGGGIMNSDKLRVFSSVITGNTADWGGGGIYNGPFHGNLVLMNTTVSSNSTRHGGGIANGGTVALISSTIALNAASDVGGGLINETSGIAGTVTMHNTLIARNSAMNNNAPDCSGTLTSQGYNLIGSTSGCMLSGDATGNRLNVDPKLGPLQHNGGPLPTHALLSGSPALDAGNPATPGSADTACPTTDQRGQRRPHDGNGDGVARCDIGAVEMVGTETGWGLTAAYYDNRDFTALKRIRLDAAVNFDWFYGSPDPAIEGSTFSVRWTGQVIPRTNETYTFYTQNDDGVRLWVNDRLLIDDWQDHGLVEHAATIALQAGQPVTIRLDYYENHGPATIKLLWSTPSQPKQIIPQSQLVPTLGLHGTYYHNRDFTSLAVSRLDPTVNFDWGYGSPDPAIEGSTFSVRWTGQVIPRASETYTLYTQNDDGVRLWVNDRLLIDDWQDHGLVEHAATIPLQAGQPVTIRLDYYENHGQATIKLLWSTPSQPKQVIPATQLLPPR
jgi:CSLREA domain-containing protein